MNQPVLTLWEILVMSLVWIGFMMGIVLMLRAEDRKRRPRE